MKIQGNRESRPGSAPQEESGFVIGGGPMIRVLKKLRQVAGLDTNVLLSGESGTGKEVAARYLHNNHPIRKNGPFVCVHCGAIPDTLLESELFGHIRGSFTGADRDRAGKFEEADGGTLFLDEISTMKPEAQVRLLRVLQDRQVTRIGASAGKQVDVRVVAASNQDLQSRIAQGEFRLDLFYRINTFPVTIPPLRERVCDIAPLADAFASKVAAKLGLNPPKHFTTDALRLLSTYEWPGNVRELQNAVEYASIVSEDREAIGPEDLPEEISGIAEAAPAASPGVRVTEDGISLRSAVGNLERELILQSMRIADGNKARAAELLDLKRTTFLEKLRRMEQEGIALG